MVQIIGIPLQAPFPNLVVQLQFSMWTTYTMLIWRRHKQWSQMMEKGRDLVVVDGNNKKQNTSLVIQEQITRVGDIAERTQSSFESYMKKEESSSVTFVMDLVVECGAIVGSDEYFIASELFVKREQREMFLHMTESVACFDWLHRKYNTKYGH
ncbi:hypothetical protein ZWY2020_017032 [Hordeum vulgare]|nr:hypothetical protein ZWY2020_017032 [Hordeum vulgare]